VYHAATGRPVRVRAANLRPCRSGDATGYLEVEYFLVTVDDATGRSEQDTEFGIGVG